MSWDGLLLDATLATLDGNGYGLIENGAIGWQDGRITYLGPVAGLPGTTFGLATEVTSAQGRLVTPGLIDCHTHLVFAGQRADEFEQRLNGASYAAIAKAGGGIMSSVRATRAASEDDLFAASLPRAQALLHDGVTTLEIKSGYGLKLDAERRMLRVARRIGNTLGMTVRTSFLGLHAVPPEFAERRDAYVTEVCEHMLPALHGEGLVDAVDGFCESIGFTRDECARLFEAAHALSIPVKLHAEQLSDCGGAALVAQCAGLSADHLEHLAADGIEAMAAAGTIAVLLPGAFYALRETRKPPLDALRTYKIPMALATDLNPGTSPLLSLRLAMNMGCTLFHMTAQETLRATTVNAASALGLSDRGTLAVGQRADFVLWNATRPADLSYWIGGSLARAVYASGCRIGGDGAV